MSGANFLTHLSLSPVTADKAAILANATRNTSLDVFDIVEDIKSDAQDFRESQIRQIS